MRNWTVLTDLDFEAVVCDLFSAKFERDVERFARGADGGIDLRWRVSSTEIGVAQCKHYSRSTFAQLLASARKECIKVREIDPDKYIFVTSFDLTLTQKDQLYEVFRDWMWSPADVYGGRDIDSLLTSLPQIERRHLKLWLTTGTQLFWAVHSDLANRADALLDRIKKTIPRYVASGSFDRASDILENQKVCLIAGVPGIGKSVLARMLVASAVTRGFAPIEVSEDISEAWAALDKDSLQVFIYDDFLGQISFSERMGKNEDKRLSDFIAKISSMKSKRLVLTTREYILREARQDYDGLRKLENELHFILELTDYSRLDKAHILYNHLWNSLVPRQCLSELSYGGWKGIVDHPNYSPRLVEYCTGETFHNKEGGYISHFVEILDHPEELWKNAYDRHLTPEQKMLLISLSSLPIEVSIEELHQACSALCNAMGLGAMTRRDYMAALEITEGTFVSLSKRDEEVTARFHNPSVAEFILDQLADDPDLLRTLVGSAVYFEQLIHIKRARTRGVTLGKKSRSRRSNTKGLPIGSLRGDFKRSYERTFDSLCPDRLRDQTGFVIGFAVPYGYLERRLLFLVNEEAPRWRPSGDWFEEKVLSVSARWREGIGSKEDAVKLIRRICSTTIISGETSVHIREALESWLSNRLENTSDWNVYLEYLDEDRERPYDRSIARRYEDFARKELDRWSPSPPFLDDLIMHAEGFHLGDLEEDLRLSAEEDEEREAATAREITDVPHQDEVAAMEIARDEDIEALFIRFQM